MFESILRAGDASVEQFIFGSWEQFLGASTPWLTALMVILVAAVGYGLWSGRIEMTLSELGPRLAKLVFVFVLVTHIDVLDRFVYRTVTEIPASVATMMVNSVSAAGGDINASVDQIYTAGMSSGLELARKGGLTNLSAYLFAAWIWVAATLGILPIAFALLLAKLAVGVLLGFAPFAIVLSLFPATRGLFAGYLRQLLGFALIPVMIYSLLALVLGIVRMVSEPLMDAASNDAVRLTFIAPYSLVMLALGLLTTQVIAWSSGIAGALTLAAGGVLARPSALVLRGTQIVQSGRARRLGGRREHAGADGRGADCGVRGRGSARGRGAAAAAPSGSRVRRAEVMEAEFEKAQTWAQDRARELERSRNRAWVVAGVSGGLTVLSMVGLVLLLPLKEAVPFVVTKDSGTGYVEVAKPAGPGLAADEALSEFSVVRYVLARETYDPGDLQSGYDLVYAASSPETWKPFAALYRRGAAGNLLDTYGTRTRVEAEVKSISFLEEGCAFVRFRTKKSTGSQTDTRHWAATLRFRFGEPPRNPEGRALNPLGFEVLSYRRDQEVADDS